MAALAMMVLFGMIGLATDFGWAFYVRKSARAAADAAALAAAKRAFASVNQSGPYNCTQTCPATGPCLICTTGPTACSSLSGSGNLGIGCQFASQNGFNDSAPQSVTLDASEGPNYVTETGAIPVMYRVTAVASQDVPQLFSAILGHGTTRVTARSTAALVSVQVDGSLILLDQRWDRARYNNGTYRGVDLLVQANDNPSYALQISGNLMMASSCDGKSGSTTECTDSGPKWLYSGMDQANGTVKVNGSIQISGGDLYASKGVDQSWLASGGIQRNAPDLGDPMTGKGQPVVPSTGLDIPVPGGVIDQALCTQVCVNGAFPAGRYYAVDGNLVPTLGQLKFSGDVQFGNSATWGDYVFYGGITSVNQGKGSTTVTFGPGSYVLAGVAPTNNGAGILLDTTTGANMVDFTAGYGKTTNAGEMFILTDGTYNGRITPPAALTGLASQLQFGTVNFQTGNNNTLINLHGLNPDNLPGSQVDLKKYGSLLFWQDPGNSTVQYDRNTVTVTCGTTGQCDNNSLANLGSPELSIQASPSIHLYGIVYQPRGAWTVLTAGGGYSGPLQLVTGSFNLHAGADLSLGFPANPVVRTVAALIQ